MSNELVTSTHAKNIADGLQSTVEYQTIYNNRSETSSRKHKTVRELAEESQNPSKRPSNFEVLFNTKLRNPDISGI